MPNTRVAWILGILSAALATGLSQGLPPLALETGDAKPAPVRGIRVSRASIKATASGGSVQANRDDQGNNLQGDAANEPSICVDPTNPQRMAIGWRQFDSLSSSFRQAGWAYSTNGGQAWMFPGVLETNVTRTDPVLAADADGRFYYLSLLLNPVFHCDLWRSDDAGQRWKQVGPAVGGDKAWLAIDSTPGPGRGNLYQTWSLAENQFGMRTFSRSTDGGANWSEPTTVPQRPYWSTLTVGPDGTLNLLGWNGTAFWFTRSTNAWDATATVKFDLTTEVNLGGTLTFATPSVNPDGLIGQPWIAADSSTGPNRGNLYALSSVSGTGNPANVMFSRSTDGGATWSAPLRLNDDPENQNSWHWFGTLSVAPNGRIDTCWYDTRNSPDNSTSELYFCSSSDGGLTWSTNRAVSPPFDHSLGYPQQKKLGDYIGMVSLRHAACIAYAATFNGEQDIYFLRLERSIITTISRSGDKVTLSWKAIPGRNYCVQYKDSLGDPWAPDRQVGCRMAEGYIASLDDFPDSTVSQRFYRVVEP